MSDLFHSLSDRFGRGRTITAAALALVVLVLLGTSAYRVLFTEPTYRITAQFSGTPGLYAGNRVMILGVPTGTITSITPGADYVRVVLELPQTVKVPADAQAVLMAPNPVSDRFVELSPAYTGGATVPHGGTITLKNTVVPLELDEVYRSLTTFAKQLGPEGANGGGALSQTLHAFAQLVDGGGTSVHDAITKLARALPALTAHPDQLKQLITGLDTLTTTLVQRNDTINRLYGDLSTATSSFADDRVAIAGAISNLQAGMAQLSRFLTDNRSTIGGSVHNLAVTVQAIAQEQRALIQTFDTAPLAFQNFGNAMVSGMNCTDRKASTCTGGWVRINPTQGADDVIKQYCGTDPFKWVLPILLSNANLAKADPADVGCAAIQGVFGAVPAPPGAPPLPPLDLAHYLGSR